MKTSRISTLVALLGAMTLAHTWTAQAAPGDLDTSFSGDGKVNTNISGGADTGRDVTIQSDGKILVAGEISTGGVGVVRYNANGTLDTSFIVMGLSLLPLRR